MWIGTNKGKRLRLKGEAALHTFQNGYDGFNAYQPVHGIVW